MTTTDLVLPVLDEAGALPWVLGRVPAGVRAIVVDNGSTDGSGDVARSLGATVVTEPARGYGAACAAGLAEATGDVVVFCDADATIDPVDAVRVAAPVVAGDADLAVAARRPFDRGAWPLHARLANRVLARQVRRLTGAPLFDLGPVRAARRDPMIGLGLGDRRFGLPLETVLVAAASGWRIVQVPVLYRARVGRSKVTGTLAGSIRASRDMHALLRGCR